MNALSETQFQVQRLVAPRTFLCTDFTLFFVAEGTLDVTTPDGTSHLQEHDIMLPEPGLTVTLDGPATTVYVQASFRPELISRISPGEELFFLCNSATDPTHSYQDLRDIFFELMRYYVAPLGRAESMTDSLMLRLYDTLLANYRLDASKAPASAHLQDERTRKVMLYVLAHYREQINLGVLADQMFVSTSTLSRSFKKSCGMYFADYVNQVRVNHAAQDIIVTDHSMTRIAYDNGFSNSSVFTKAFKDVFGITPKAYRQQHEATVQGLPGATGETDQQIRESLSLREEYVRSLAFGEKPAESATRVRFSMLDEGTPYQKVWNQFVNVGSVYDMTRANVQRHVLYLQEHLGIRGVRVWNAFAKRLNIIDEYHQGEHNFDVVDQALDFLMENGLQIYFDLGPRPDTIYRGDGEVVRWRDDYVNPATRKDWEALLASFVKHVIRRYKRHVVSHWIFDITHDAVHGETPELRYHQGSDYDFWGVYEHAYRLIKRELPDARVGTSSAIVNLEWEFLTSGLERCKAQNIRPDFLSFIMFPYSSGKDDVGGFHKQLSLEKDSELNQMRLIKTLAQQAGMADVPIYISEFNNSVSGRNPFNDSCFRAAYFAQKVDELWGEADLVIPMMASDWVDADSDFHGIAGGGLGLLTKDTVEKPAFHMLQFLNLMGDRVVGRGDNWIVTQRNARDYYILAFNYQWFAKRYFLEPEDRLIDEGETGFFETDDPIRILVTVDDAAASEYFVKTRTIRTSEGCVLRQWEDFGYETNLTSSDIDYLRRSCYPRIQLRKVKAEKNTITLELKPDLHEVLLIHMYES